MLENEAKLKHLVLPTSFSWPCCDNMTAGAPADCVLTWVKLLQESGKVPASLLLRRSSCFNCSTRTQSADKSGSATARSVQYTSTVAVV